MNAQKPDDRRDKPQYVKGDGHHKSRGWSKWLWLLLIALVALAALSMCNREEVRKTVPAEEEIIEEQEITPDTPPETTP